MGLTRQYRLLADEAVLQIRADRYDHPPYGLFGGKPAGGSRNVLNPDSKDAELLPPKTTMQVTSGVVLRHEQAGGGGYGAPINRDLALVAEDLSEGKITPAFASEHYGAIFKDGALDLAATKLQRRNG